MRVLFGILLTLAVVVAPSLVAASEPEGVKLQNGWLKWGEDKEAARNLSPNPSKYFDFSCSTLGRPAGIETCRMGSGGVDFGDGARLAELYFFNGQFFRWEMPLPPDRFDFISEAMTKRLGKPSSDKKSTIQNRMGASFDQREQSWDSKTTVARLSMRGRDGKVDVGEVVVINKSIEKQIPSPSADAPF